MYCPPILIKFVTQDGTNACYVRFVCFSIRRSERRALLVGVKQLLYVPSTFMVSFGEIRHESSARIVDRFRI
jgi:hypothetical protein